MQKHDRLKFFAGIFFAILYCCAPIIYAVESLTFNVAKITANDWSLNRAVLKITTPSQAPPKVSLQSATLQLPPPLQFIKDVDIKCKHFLWQENNIECSQGHGRFSLNKFKTFSFDFSARFKDNSSTININQLSFLGGNISIYAHEIGEKWQLRIKAQDINIIELASLLALDYVEISQGTVDFEIESSGEQNELQAILVSALFEKLSLNDLQGTLASENVKMELQFSANKDKGGWQWHNSANLQEGGLYVEPVYIEFDTKNSIAFTANGLWQQEQKLIQVKQFKLDHPRVVLIQGDAVISHQSGTDIKSAKLKVKIAQLEHAAPVYLLPFLESGTFSEIELAGIVEAQLNVSQGSLSKVSVNIKNLVLDDAEKRFSMHQANAQINWAQSEKSVSPSFIQWQGLKIQSIPFQAGQLDFISADNQIKLLKPTNLAVLGGFLSINHFSFSTTENNTDASIHFDGSINDLSLEQLSKEMDWTPLTGEISGHIPSVRYHNKTLSLGGEIKMQVFGGEITIKKLASSGLFTDFSQFYTDIEFDHLDLDTITHKFDIGYIEGRLSGTVQKLYLENWQPVSFYAWVGTPEGDDSTHRISQKAVESIASIGGGGVSDALSRGLLGLFSTFGYNKLGFGCYLHDGVCQLMGVEAIGNGFYLIKGGGLPRVDVIGYNPRLDWKILFDRISRITASDEVIVE